MKKWWVGLSELVGGCVNLGEILWYRQWPISFCAIIICCPSRLCVGQCHLKIRYHKRGLCLKNDCVMNMTVECHEYRGGCILTFSFGGRGDITYLFAFPLFEAYMGSRHFCTAAAVLWLDLWRWLCVAPLILHLAKNNEQAETSKFIAEKHKNLQA